MRPFLKAWAKTTWDALWPVIIVASLILVLAFGGYAIWYLSETYGAGVDAVLVALVFFFFTALSTIINIKDKETK